MPLLEIASVLWVIFMIIVVVWLIRETLKEMKEGFKCRGQDCEEHEDICPTCGLCPNCHKEMAEGFLK